VRVYHSTSRETAEAIERDGFRDGTGTYLTSEKFTGVWVSDRPLDENEGGMAEALLIVEVPDAELEPYEWVEEGKPYREWLVPAELLNGHGITERADY
jgi:hypothetical protein